MHNAQVQAVQTEEVSADELWSFVSKNIHQCLPDELEAGDCWIGVSLADSSGLILAARVGKRTDELLYGIGRCVVRGRPLANAGIVMAGEVTKEYCPLKFCTTLVRIRHSA